MDAANNVTKSMPFIANILSGECYNTLFIDGNILNGPCLRLLTSKIIGYSLILVTTLLVKTPQIIKLFQVKSAEGISFGNCLASLITGAVSVVYNIVRGFPFSTWGESFSLLLQSLLMAYLLLYYNDRKLSALLFVVICVIFVPCLCHPAIPMSVHEGLQALSWPIISWGKCHQIWMNYKAKSTGAQSHISILFMNFRSLGRLFTSFVELGDFFRIGLYSIASVLNCIQTIQMVMYNKPSRKKAD